VRQRVVLGWGTGESSSLESTIVSCTSQQQLTMRIIILCWDGMEQTYLTFLSWSVGHRCCGGEDARILLSLILLLYVYCLIFADKTYFGNCRIVGGVTLACATKIRDVIWTSKKMYNIYYYNAVKRVTKTSKDALSRRVQFNAWHGVLVRDNDFSFLTLIYFPSGIVELWFGSESERFTIHSPITANKH